ncbi:RagB/SusD family nutrient uptake outer membrane protein [Flavivirga algicola]|uniref:RagB/SusD family nutrient uptake outer membrane protein n=1 Tax=Flavivirga algicola TaxID=2729136 RepID=A0ABX1RYG9_9FLAO|nr:RagB/SusD family nutrient uptake outer membrane protein [Flavivirga algicola]NMH87385.1 RagB/SusD family nutrient uptake outer membrane protein [Flavivirga algicola]
MKKIQNNLIKLTLLFMLVITSCNESVFLDEQNPNFITPETFWETEGQFQAALAAVYGALQYRSISGAELVQEFVLGDIGGTESWYRPFAFRNLAFNDGILHVVDKWEECYVGIFRANQVIVNLETVDEDVIDDESKAIIDGQARFLRAFFYWQLVHSYGGAMIHTDIARATEDFNQPLSSMEEVTNTIIIPDLQIAIDNLPETWDGEDIGRITWGAATTMMAKVHLFDENWPEAARLFKEVIDSDIYALTRDITDNFWHENEFNEESILEVNYSFDINPGNSGFPVDDTPFNTGSESTTLSTEIGRLGAGGFNTVLPTYNLHEMLVNDEVDPDNSINDDNLESRRMNGTIAPENGEGLWYQEPYGTIGGWGGGQSAYVKKHSNWYHLPAEPAEGRSGINFRHIRYADVLLMYAEAVIEANGDFMTAMQYVDMVRSRAGVYTLQQYMDMNGGMFPQLHVSKQVHGDWPMVAPSSETVMTHIRRVERAVELCYEGHRWKDLVRWGIVQEVFDELRADEIWRQENLASIQDPTEQPFVINGHVRPDFSVAQRIYDPEQHNYFPIPSTEIQSNELFNQ